MLNHPINPTQNNPVLSLNAADLTLSDWLTLLPLTRHSMAGLGGMGIEWRILLEEISSFVHANDLPPSLREFYRAFADRLSAIHSELKAVGNEAESVVSDLFYKTCPKFDVELSEAEIARLLQLNQQLVTLEAAIVERVSSLSRALGAVPAVDTTDLAWCAWDTLEVNLWLVFAKDADRPSYRPDLQDGYPLENMALSDLKIYLDLNDVSRLSPNHAEYWGIGDGKDHNDIPCDFGYPLAGVPLCMLFHELFDHADVGLKGMLQLEKILLDVRLEQSATYQLMHE